MNRFLFAVVLILLIGPANAQIKSVQNVEFLESSYLVTNDAVIVKYIKDKDIPFKIYDYATRSVFVYFGEGENKALSTLSFSEIAPDEIAHVNEIGCANAPLNNAFRRFCK